MPGQVTLDLAMKIVQPSQNIWAIFPGLGRRYFTDFLSENVIFLDTPSIDLPNPEMLGAYSLEPSEETSCLLAAQTSTSPF